MGVSLSSGLNCPGDSLGTSRCIASSSSGPIVCEVPLNWGSHASHSHSFATAPCRTWGPPGHACPGDPAGGKRARAEPSPQPRTPLLASRNLRAGQGWNSQLVVVSISPSPTQCPLSVLIPTPTLISLTHSFPGWPAQTCPFLHHSLDGHLGLF